MRLFPFVVVALVAVVALAVSARPRVTPLAPTAQVDLARYMGRWWVIANTPYFAENGKVATADVYALRPDGTIDNTYAYRKAFDQPESYMHAVARVVPGTHNAQWRIGFFWGLLKADYLVLEVAPDYSWALIGQPSRKYAWVFAREPRMDDALYARLVTHFVRYGYDPARLRRIPQFPDQVGKPGFQ
jgi:apolipoprotein D and lipocalin family protein